LFVSDYIFHIFLKNSKIDIYDTVPETMPEIMPLAIQLNRQASVGSGLHNTLGKNKRRKIVLHAK
jgi:hypothetical protein